MVVRGLSDRKVGKTQIPRGAWAASASSARSAPVREPAGAPEGSAYGSRNWLKKRFRGQRSGRHILRRSRKMAALAHAGRLAFDVGGVAVTAIASHQPFALSGRRQSGNVPLARNNGNEYETVILYLRSWWGWNGQEFIKSCAPNSRCDQARRTRWATTTPLSGILRTDGLLAGNGEGAVHRGKPCVRSGKFRLLVG